MIQRGQVVSLFLQACPELAPAWEQECREWDLNPADGMELQTAITVHPDPNPQLYLHLPRLVWEYLIAHYAVGRTGHFPAIFDLIERCIVEGDKDDRYVSEFAVIGVLEDLQGAVLRKGLPDDAFFPWLGRESKEAWNDLHRFWGTGPSAADDSSGSQP
jgi:hypothetical protein